MHPSHVPAAQDGCASRREVGAETFLRINFRRLLFFDIAFRKVRAELPAHPSATRNTEGDNAVVFLTGAFTVHLTDRKENGNKNPGNAGPVFFADIVMPTGLWGLYLVR